MKIKKQYIIVIFSLIILVLCAYVLFFKDKTKLTTSSTFAMDTYMNFQVWSSDDETEKSNQLVSDLDKQFSMYNNGALAELNKDAGKPVTTTDNLFDIIEKSNTLSAQYGNEVDITSGSLTKLWGVSTDTPYLPTNEEALEAVSHIDYSKVTIDSKDKSITIPQGTMIDLGSVGKGYACDKLKELFDNSGKVPCAIVSMGSSSLLYGTKPDKSRFSVEIKNPDGGAALGIIKTGETFVSTSGGYERFFEVDGVKYSHIFDLKTGFPAKSDITSVTILCDSGLKSDFLSTLVFIDGVDGLKEHLNSSDYKIIAATDDKKIYVSSSIDFTLNKDCGYTLEELK